MLGGGGELVTLLVGERAPAGLGEAVHEYLRNRWPFVEVQCYAGGQPRLSAAGGGGMTVVASGTDTPLKTLVGAKTAKALADRLDLHTAGDLIYHFPRRYDERGEHTDIRALDVGEQVTVLAQVQRTTVRPMRQRRGSLLEVIVGDGSGGQLTLTFFGNQAWRERELRPGRWGLFAGKVTEFRGKRQLNGPEYVLLGETGDGRGRDRGDRGVRRRADPGLPGRGGGADLGDRPLRTGGAGHRRRRPRTRCRRQCGPSGS